MFEVVEFVCLLLGFVCSSWCLANLKLSEFAKICPLARAKIEISPQLFESAPGANDDMQQQRWHSETRSRHCIASVALGSREVRFGANKLFSDSAFQPSIRHKMCAQTLPKRCGNKLQHAWHDSRQQASTTTIQFSATTLQREESPASVPSVSVRAHWAWSRSACAPWRVARAVRVWRLPTRARQTKTTTMTRTKRERATRGRRAPQRHGTAHRTGRAR